MSFTGRRSKLLVGYARRNTVEIFKISKETVQKIGGGKVEELKPYKSFGKKVLIVGREAYLHLRKRYPPAKFNDLKKAISLEIDDLFPIKGPAHAFKVFERTTSYTLVDVWAWESSLTESISTIFPFTHVIPEDAVLFSHDPEIGIKTDNGHTHLVAYFSGGYIASTMIKGNLTPEQLEVFLKGLGRYRETFKTLVFFDTPDQKIVSSLKVLALDISTKPMQYPVCIDSVSKVNLKDYAQSVVGFFDIIPVVMRGIIYLLVGVCISFVLSGRNYDLSVAQMNKKISKLSGDMASLTSGPRQENLRDVTSELNKKTGEGIRPLAVLDMIAGALPEKSYVTRAVLGDRNLEMTIMSNDPLNVIKVLGGMDMVRSLKLRGPPIRDQSRSANQPETKSKGTHSFTVTVELK